MMCKVEQTIMENELLCRHLKRYAVAALSANRVPWAKYGPFLASIRSLWHYSAHRHQQGGTIPSTETKSGQPFLSPTPAFGTFFSPTDGALSLPPIPIMVHYPSHYRSFVSFLFFFLLPLTLGGIFYF